jgi:hypothetical protein
LMVECQLPRRKLRLVPRENSQTTLVQPGHLVGMSRLTASRGIESMEHVLQNTRGY